MWALANDNARSPAIRGKGEKSGQDNMPINTPRSLRTWGRVGLGEESYFGDVESAYLEHIDLVSGSWRCL
ncbi:hypothetical protein O988_07758 [Pseudogymnoascus sp. VKM F-3808]|nr:hypothetical protein O988_07758 [Pseudogymnoascus sp. VKM F-3808]